ncbi:MAG: hypothetical protein KGJ98_08875 [Chloroflexota bacterium]|nr:hypothetical protein [Chloroflexota bacterium]
MLRYTGSFTVGEAPGSPFIDGEPAFDIVSEIWCSDLPAIQSAYDGLRRAGGPLDTLSHAGTRIAFLAEEHVIFDKTK